MVPAGIGRIGLGAEVRQLAVMECLRLLARKASRMRRTGMRIAIILGAYIGRLVRENFGSGSSPGSATLYLHQRDATHDRGRLSIESETAAQAPGCYCCRRCCSWHRGMGNLHAQVTAFHPGWMDVGENFMARAAVCAQSGRRHPRILMA